MITYIATGRNSGHQIILYGDAARAAYLADVASGEAEALIGLRAVAQLDHEIEAAVRAEGNAYGAPASYTLTAAEAAVYDAGDDVAMRALLDSLTARFGRRDDAAGATEVYHPDGYVVGRWGSAG